MKDQIVKLIETEGLSPTRFADEIGVQRSSISHIISGRNKPSYDFILKIINRYPGINAEWLITGAGSMIKSSDTGSKKLINQSGLFDEKEFNERANINRKEERERDSIHSRSEKTISNYSSSKLDMKNIVTDVNSVDYILVFYSDGTFKKFKPRE